jgi:DeoR/GlpR family transcriptional regulator of sugar metabolism
MTRKIFREERLQEIYEQLLREKKVYVQDLATKFGVSPSSIRMDLVELDSRGLASRIYGGALLPTPRVDIDAIQGATREWRQELVSRSKISLAEKEAIGKSAAGLVQDGDTLMIDGGSTTQYVVKYLKGKRGLTIITNSIPLVPDLLTIEDTDIYLVGGLIYKDNAVLAGDITNTDIEQFNVMKAILGIDGIGLDAGLTAANPSASVVASTKRAMISSCNQLIIVADHTKLGKTCLVPVAPLEAMHYLVTDSDAPHDLLGAIRSRGPEVVIAEIPS